MNALNPTAVARATTTTSLVRRITLLVACAVAAALAQGLATDAAGLAVDPELATLLRGMALVKGMLVLAAVVAVWWRFGWPATSRSAWAYALGLAAMVGATVLIAHLASIAAAAVTFHAGALLVMIVAWRDEGLALGLSRGALPTAAAPVRGARAAAERDSTRRPSSLPGIVSHAG